MLYVWPSTDDGQWATSLAGGVDFGGLDSFGGIHDDGLREEGHCRPLVTSMDLGIETDLHDSFIYDQGHDRAFAHGCFDARLAAKSAY